MKRITDTDKKTVIAAFFCVLMAAQAHAFTFDMEPRQEADEETVYSSTAAVQASTGPAVVDIRADEMTYDRKNEVIYASGSVKIRYRDMQLDADEVEYERKNKRILARGNVDMRKETHTIRSESIVYNIESSTGVVYNALVISPPMYVYADKVDMLSRDEFYVPKGFMSTCQGDPPPYKFQGEKIRLKVNERVSAYNTMLYVKGVPAFYYPYYSKSLGPKKLKVSIDVGSNDTKGRFVQTKVAYPFTENSETYAALDVMSTKGVGGGLGHRYSTEEGFSSIDTYYIKEQDTSRSKGSLYLRGWQEIFDDLNVRYRTEYTSDFSFNYDYTQDTAEYKERLLYYELGFDYTRPKYIATIYGSKQEEWSGLVGDENYYVRDYVLPGAEFRLFPLKLSRLLTYSARTSYRNFYIPSTEEWESQISWDNRLNTTHRLNVGRYYYATFTPGVGYDGLYYRDTVDNYGSLFMGLSQGWLNRLFLDNNYTWRRAWFYPYIVTTSYMAVTATYRPDYRLELQVRSSYDFREYETSRVYITEPIGNFYSTLRYRYRRNSLYIRNQYDYYDRQSIEWLYELWLGGFSETRVKYYYFYPDRLEVGQRLSFSVLRQNVSVGGRFYLDKSGGGFYKFDRFFEKSLGVLLKMNCWDYEFRLLRRGEETMFWVLLNISAFPEKKVGLYGNIEQHDYRYHRE
ncbi:MAG: LPS-assembly protein LptD [Elusimicrobia bacterium]|nr:LPS-assembly protein LptD [Elusimicrobiota bacterium]